MTELEDSFVITRADAPARWAVGRPVDVHGDGYTHMVDVELSDDGIAARGQAAFDGRGPENLRDFLVALEKHWRGWRGARSWTSVGEEMTVEAHHDGRGYVSLAVTLRRAERTYAPDAWSARVVLTVEAGEELRRIADAAQRLLRP
ncbi:hypothetical protein DFP74_2207 [Nocardiopsis sp. Huas11]|uniref:DUF6228 family protein n=1 Tax=Nocardiopsis sp. Huas11 TaxID=2183912 RepID=UPI000EB3ACAD|nr:DUF6228 family protein [Nocardiopsis sp. Huas11]RKS06569.1 hypothetical protein DFP74_2207 [Nocardiopsis sp. Huas11]